MTRVLCASGVAGVAFLAAAVDAGAIGGGRRVLVVANEAETPEVVPDPTLAPGFDALAARMDDVVSWNELIAPLHPSAWRPPQREIPVLARLLAARLAPHDTVDELVVESVTEGPGRTLAALVPDVAITVATHTLVAYAPVLVGASSEVGLRVARLLHLDLLPGVRPLLRHPGTTTVDAVALDAYRAAIAPLAAPRESLPGPAVDAVVLGERYAERGLLGAEDEVRLRVDAVRALTEAGHRHIVFAPDPAAGPEDHDALIEAAESAGAQLTFGATGLPHEAWTADPGALVVGTRSPALFVAGRAATSGCDRLLARPLRYDHPDRMPLTITDALLPQLAADGSVGTEDVDLSLLVDAVAFLIAPVALPQLRDRAAEWVARNGVAPYLRPSLVKSLGVGVGVGGPGGPAGTAGAAGRSGRAQRIAGRARSWFGSRQS